MWFLIFRHVYTHHHALIVKQRLSQCSRQLGLSHACRSEEEERAYRPVRVGQSCTASSHCVGHQCHRFVLTHYAFVQLVFEVQQPLSFRQQHPRHRYPCPARHHFGHLLRIHLLVYHGVVGLHRFQLRLQLFDMFLSLFDSSVSQLRHLSVVAGSLGLFCLKLVRLNILHFRLDGFDYALLVLPAGFHLVALFAQLVYLVREVRQLLLVVLAFDGFAFDFQLPYLAFYLVQLFWHRVYLQPQFRRRLVYQVDGFVGQEPVADVAVRKLGCRDDGFVFDTHLVVHLVAFFQPSQYRYRVGYVGLVYQHTLEPARQRLVFLEIFLIFGKCGRTDGPQLASRQRGFQYVCRIHSPFASAGSHEGVYLVDEEYYLAVGLAHFSYHRLQSLLEFTFIFSACDKRSHIEREYRLRLQVLGHVARHYPVRQTLCYCGFTNTWLTNQYRVVFSPSR